MSLLANLKSSNDIVAEKDVLGGDFSALDSGIYTGEIKYAYLQKAKSSNALSLNISVMINGKEYREQLWVSNKQGENFYTKDGNKSFLPGFNIAESIALFTTGKSLASLETEDKAVNIYNSDQKKEVPTLVPCITDMHGKEISLAIIKEVRPKQKNVGTAENPKWMDSDETREVNVTQKVFHPVSHKTVAEIRAKVETAEFYDKWLEKNKDHVRVIKPKGTVASTAAAGNQSPAVSSLFGNG